MLLKKSINNMYNKTFYQFNKILNICIMFICYYNNLLIIRNIIYI